MSYLDAVINESLRLYTPAYIISRRISEDITLGQDIIPKGVSLFLMIQRLQRDPIVFPEPLHFKPERFLEENQFSSDNSFGFIPFSGGARNCIGQKFAINEIKIIMAKVLLNYSLVSLEERDELIIFDGLLSKPLNGIKMLIRRRSVETD